MACQKKGPKEPPSEVPPAIAPFESLFTHPTVSFCGSTFTSDLKIKEGKNIGTVTVGNDNLYLYLTYNLEQNWYLKAVQSFAGTQSQIPKTSSGSPNPGQFPGKQPLNACDLRQTFTFRVALSSLTTESEANCAARYFVAMRAEVTQVANPSSCATGKEEEAWAAPILINPGKDHEWATAFYYCKQDCPPPPPPAPAWCSYSQGYWFASGRKDWGSTNEVVYGNLHVSKDDGLKIWDKKNRTVLQKAFLQASALQLSRNLINNGLEIPADIKVDYDLIASVLATIDYNDLNSGNPANGYPTGIKEKDVQDAAGRIGKWICTHHCNDADDPTACTTP